MSPREGPPDEASREGQWSVIVHGGARSIPASERALHAEGCHQAASVAAAILSKGGTSLDAAEMAVRLLEDLPWFNAGRGSVRNADGFIEMDAAIMDGETLDLGGVSAIQNVRHPIEVARALLTRPPVLLTGCGAMRFAAEIGAEAPLEQDDIASGSGAGGDMESGDTENGGGGCDTVGCVALDMHGHLAAAGSTGGIAGKMVGRVGDTPLPGCGLYADDEQGAVACSGEGESIARVMVAAHAIQRVSAMSPTLAARSAVERLARVKGEAGIILINPAGRMGIAHNSDQFSLGIAASWLNTVHAATDAANLGEWLE